MGIEGKNEQDKGDSVRLCCCYLGTYFGGKEYLVLDRAYVYILKCLPTICIQPW